MKRRVGRTVWDRRSVLLKAAAASPRPVAMGLQSRRSPWKRLRWRGSLPLAARLPDRPAGDHLCLCVHNEGGTRHDLGSKVSHFRRPVAYRTQRHVVLCQLDYDKWAAGKDKSEPVQRWV